MTTTETKIIVAELTPKEAEMLKQILLATKAANQNKLDEMIFNDVKRLYEIYKESEDDGSFPNFETFAKCHNEMTEALKKGVEHITSLCEKILK